MDLVDCIPCGFVQGSYIIDELILDIAKKAVLHASQSSSIFFGFVFHASSFILPNTHSMMFMSGDWAGQSWNILIFFALRNFDVEMECCFWATDFDLEAFRDRIRQNCSGDHMDFR
ncbi:hypothetical protein QQF64_018468 [Cirrhinus molitorella]|uniref:Uncharacterized protein n=1 Tax=Cirrhinus molitorella TaxID=172907 RepID=A0ABR3LCP7_9TELE